jgi:hypothetical protein
VEAIGVKVTNVKGIEKKQLKDDVELSTGEGFKLSFG